MTDQPPPEEPGYGRSPNGMIVHRIRPDGHTYCPDGYATTVGDRDSARDAVHHHGARFCTACINLMAH